MNDGTQWYFVYCMQMYTIPDRMREGIELYVNNGIRPGGFLCAVISNDLMRAVMRADDENMANLPAYANYLYNYAPHDCWGSEKEMEKWIKKKQQQKGGDS